MAANTRAQTLFVGVRGNGRYHVAIRPYEWFWAYLDSLVCEVILIIVMFGEGLP